MTRVNPCVGHPHIHTPFDGRGRRGVSVNGVVVDRCVYADTKRGIVRVCTGKVHRFGKRMVHKTMRGMVEVWDLQAKH